MEKWIWTHTKNKQNEKIKIALIKNSGVKYSTMFRVYEDGTIK